MVYSTISQIVTLLAVGLALVWHQQRGIDKLRKEFQRGQRSLRKEFQRNQQSLRKEFQRGQRSLRRELRRDHAELKGIVENNGQRLARIEGFLGVAVPPEAASRAPGAAYAGRVADTVADADETLVPNDRDASRHAGDTSADPTESAP